MQDLKMADWWLSEMYLVCDFLYFRLGPFFTSFKFLLSFKIGLMFTVQ